MARLAAYAILAIGPILWAAAQEKEERTMVPTHGFRQDPMTWVEQDRTLQGAMVRTRVLGKPRRGDRKLMQAEIDKILAKQLDDGRLSDDPNHSYQFTAEALIRLAGMGCPAGRAEVKKAVAAVLAKPKANQADPYGIYDVRAFCLLGLTDQPKFRDLARAGLGRIMAREKEWNSPNAGCPWTPIEHLITLWHGREVAKTEPLLAKALTWIAKGINPAGCLSYKDPWGFVRLASVVDHPLAKTILEREVPMLLRAQRPDGGWGDKSLVAFRALHRHGLLEPLRKRPPLPPDWRIVKSIPAPAADCFTLAWDGKRLWTKCGKTSEAVAVSPADGKVVRRLKLRAKGAFGLGTWDDDLAVTDNKAKKLLRIDAETGKVVREIDLGKMEWINGVTEVGGKLAVGDGFMGNVMIYDPADPAKPEPRVLGGPIPVDLATDGDAVWHLDVWAPALIKSGLGRHGHLLDWGEKPFDGRCDGIAFDGTRLWALDRKGQRICAIEKDAPAEQPQVLLDEAVAAFDHMQKHVASHEDWGEGMYPYPQPCVYLQMHLVEMQTMGWEIDFDTLVAVSGASALFAYQPKEFMPKYANLHIGMDRRIAEATGFGYEWVPFKDAEEAWQIIKETVDSGRVAKGWDYENCAFCGYQDAAKPEDRKVFAIGDGPGTFSTWWTWKQFTEWLDRITKWKQNRLGRHTRRVRKVPAKKIALRVMQDLVTWSTAPPEACREHFAKATFGLAGIERYAADCADVRKFPDWGMCHDINPQWTVRHSTAVYLGRIAEGKLFPTKVRADIAKAAAQYKAAAAAWHKTYGLLGHGATKEQRRDKARRQQAAALIRQAIEHERNAIDALTQVLPAGP